MIPEQLKRYEGRAVEIVYIDKRNRITRRTVVVIDIQGNAASAYCLNRRAPRLFKLDRILAFSPAERRMG